MSYKCGRVAWHRNLERAINEDTPLDITPVLNREMLTATRKTRLWGGRGYSAGTLLAVILATFGARYYWDRGQVSDHDMMARVAFQAFLWMLVAHMIMVLGVFTRAALSIALEKDRRTLDFLLATQLSNADIVLGKLAACISILIADIAVGLPIMLIMSPLGGIDLRLILLAYAGLITTGFFAVALAICVSSGASDIRRATGVSVLALFAWLIGPMFVSLVFTKVVLRLPGFILTVNAWILTSSPMGLMLKIAGGVTPSTGLVEAVAWMSGLQVAGGTVLIVWTIARLRSAYRVNVSGDSHSPLARLTRPGWRWRPKPPVGDDPILWREMNLARSGLFGYAVGLLIGLAFFGVLVYITYFFARPALVEVWRHGYSSGITSAERPEWNLVIRFFMSNDGVNLPADTARTEFNLFLRQVTTTMVVLLLLVSAGTVTEAIVSERARETWDSLIATPLTARDILRSKMLVALWRLRAILVILLGLWTLGLVAGAIHPVGFLFSVLFLAALIWFMLAFGIYISIGAKDMAATTGPTMALVFLLTGAGVLPLLLPGRINSVVLGAGSPPLVAFLSLASYRDVRNAWHYPVYPFLQWMDIATDEGSIRVAATCLIGIALPAVAGFVLWRFSLTHFDRLIGRPFKTADAPSQHVGVASVATT
jgi:ABC-type Na+ efflux pump permease subunit